MKNLSQTNSESTFSLNKLRQFALILCVGVYILLWFGGLSNHLVFGGVSENLNWLGSLFLFLAGIILFLTIRRTSELLMLAGFALFGFSAEILGVYTGFPFGSYNYTDTLGFRILGVPLVMGFAWLTLILYVRETLLPFNISRFTESMIAGLLATSIDLVIDPIAVNHLGYWQWQETGSYYNIPFTNFAGWFLTGFTAFYIFQRKSETNKWHFSIGLSITLFFTILALIHNSYLAAIIGLTLCGLSFLSFIIRKNQVTTEV